MDDFEPRFFLGYWTVTKPPVPYYPPPRSKTHIVDRETNRVMCDTSFDRQDKVLIERDTNIRKMKYQGKKACKYCKQLVHRYYLYNTVEELEDEYVRAREMDDRQILF